MAAGGSSRKTILLALLVAAVIPYFLNLGVSSLWDANEAFYAQTPREMIAASDYVNPTFNFQPRFNKPVFSYWEVAAAYRLFGVSEFSERLPIAVSGVILIAVAFGLARLIGGTHAGLLAAVVLASSPRVLLLARRIIIDVQIAMFTGLVLLCFALSEMRPERRRLYLVLMYIAAGFGVLTKGPVAVFLPGLVFLAYLASRKRLRDVSRMMLPLGATIGLAIVAPWYYLVYRQHGWGHITSFIVGENLERFAAAIGAQSRGLLFYIPVMLGDLFPWSLFIPVALWWGVRARAHPVARLLVMWVAVFVVFFSLSGTKEDLYILPIVTAEAALIGAMMSARAGRAGPPASEEEPRLGGAVSDSVARWVSVGTGCLLAVAGAVLVWAFGVSHRYTLAGASAIGLVAAAGGVVAVIMADRRHVFGAVAAVAGALVVLSWSVVLVSLPDFERYKPVRPFADIIRSRASEKGIVGSYKSSLPSMVYYLNRPIVVLESPDELLETFSSTSDIHFVMPEAEYQRMKDRLSSPTYVLAHRRLFDIRPKNFLDGSELPELVLISNRPGTAAAR